VLGAVPKEINYLLWKRERLRGKENRGDRSI
jgi:hypothetical protein